MLVGLSSDTRTIKSIENCIWTFGEIAIHYPAVLEKYANNIIGLIVPIIKQPYGGTDNFIGIFTTQLTNRKCMFRIL